MMTTSRTDAARSKCRSTDDLYGCKPLLQCAYNLERELTAAREQLKAEQSQKQYLRDCLATVKAETTQTMLKIERTTLERAAQLCDSFERLLSFGVAAQCAAGIRDLSLTTESAAEKNFTKETSETIVDTAGNSSREQKTVAALGANSSPAADPMSAVTLLKPIAEFKADENGYITPRALPAWDGTIGPLYAIPPGYIVVPIEEAKPVIYLQSASDGLWVHCNANGNGFSYCLDYNERARPFCNAYRAMLAAGEKLPNELRLHSQERELFALRCEWEDMKHRCSSAQYLIQLVKDTMREHRDPDSAFYNECESDPCKWCTDAAEAIRIATSS